MAASGRRGESGRQSHRSTEAATHAALGEEVVEQRHRAGRVVAERGEESEGLGEGRERGEVRGEGRKREALQGAREEEHGGEEAPRGGDVASGEEPREERGDGVELGTGEPFGWGFGWRQRGGADAAKDARESAGEWRREAAKHRVLGPVLLGDWFGEGMQACGRPSDRRATSQIEQRAVKTCKQAPGVTRRPKPRCNYLNSIVRVKIRVKIYLV